MLTVILFNREYKEEVLEIPRKITRPTEQSHVDIFDLGRQRRGDPTVNNRAFPFLNGSPTAPTYRGVRGDPTLSHLKHQKPATRSDSGGPSDILVRGTARIRRDV